MFRDYTKYEVFENGQIWSYKSKKFLKPQTNHNGYQLVKLFDNYGKAKWYQLHRVVYEAVSGEPIPEGLQVNHIDERKDNNMRSNLELMTPKQNTNYGTGVERSHKSQRKQVGAFNKNGELVMTFQSTMEAGRQGFHSSAVVSCCNGKRKTHKGFTWKYL